MKIEIGDWLLLGSVCLVFIMGWLCLSFIGGWFGFFWFELVCFNLVFVFIMLGLFWICLFLIWICFKEKKEKEK